MTQDAQYRTERRRAGFSLLEALLAVSVGMIVATTAIPNMSNGIANIRLRSSMTSMSGVLQNCRMLAVKSNRTMSTHFQATSYGVMAFVKRASDTGSLAVSDSQVQLQAPVSRLTSPTGANAPAALDSSTLGFTPQTGDPSFNTTGMPCAYSGGTCTNYGFVYYFTDTRWSGNNGWAAISISPAGRIKRWFWNGSAWAD